MCSVGDPFRTGIESPEMDVKFYRCSDCRNEFKGIGKKVTCPSCNSTKVSLMFE